MTGLDETVDNTHLRTRIHYIRMLRINTRLFRTRRLNLHRLNECLLPTTKFFFLELVDSGFHFGC